MTQQQQKGAEQPFVFVVQLMFPGPPHLTLVIYFAPHAFSPIRGDGTPFSEVMSKFLDGTDQDRTDRFKVIPRVVEVRALYWAFEACVRMPLLTCLRNRMTDGLDVGIVVHNDAQPLGRSPPPRPPPPSAPLGPPLTWVCPLGSCY